MRVDLDESKRLTRAIGAPSAAARPSVRTASARAGA